MAAFTRVQLWFDGGEVLQELAPSLAAIKGMEDECVKKFELRGIERVKKQ